MEGFMANQGYSHLAISIYISMSSVSRIQHEKSRESNVAGWHFPRSLESRTLNLKLPPWFRQSYLPHGTPYRDVKS